MITPVTNNPDGTQRKSNRNKTFVLDKRNCEIRTYTRSNITNEVGAPKVETFGSKNIAQIRFNCKK